MVYLNKVWYIDVPSGYLLHSHGIDGPVHKIPACEKTTGSSYVICIRKTSHVEMYHLCSHRIFFSCYQNLTDLWLNVHLHIPKSSPNGSLHAFSHHFPIIFPAFSHGFSVHLRSKNFRAPVERSWALRRWSCRPWSPSWKCRCLGWDGWDGWEIYKPSGWLSPVTLW